MKVSTYIFCALAVAAVSIYFAKPPINAVPISLPPLPELPENYHDLSKASQLFYGQTPGPEAFTVGEKDLIYTGLADGRIVQFDLRKPQSFPITITFTGDPNLALPFPCGTYQTEPLCGRPLGLHWDTHGAVAKRAGKRFGQLIVADAYKGLLAIDIHKRTINSLTKRAKGDKKDFSFPNDLDVASDGIIYFTDSSDTYQRRDFHFILLEGRPTGRILSYDPKTTVTNVVLANLSFPNGIRLSHDEERLYFAETTLARISYVYIRGPKKGEVGTLIDNLPGFPDNLEWSNKEKTKFWVGCGTKRTKPFSLADTLAPFPPVRNLIAKVLPTGGSSLLSFIPKFGLALEIEIQPNGDSARIVSSLQDRTGRIPFLSSVFPARGSLLLGTPHSHLAYVARLPFPDSQFAHDPSEEQRSKGESE